MKVLYPRATEVQANFSAALDELTPANAVTFSKPCVNHEDYMQSPWNTTRKHL